MKKFITAICLTLLSTVAFAGDAVSAVNGKASVLAGNIDGKSTEAIDASVTLPVAANFGVQLDGLVGTVSDNQIHGSAVHGFWRDSDVGLLGLIASHAELGDTEANLAGIEGEYYLKDFTFGAMGGEQTGDVSGSWATLSADYFPLDDLLLRAKYAEYGGLDQAGVEVEYLFPHTAISLYLDIASGENDFDQTIVGLRYYMGADKSLKRRLREDDPRSPLLDSLPSVVDRHDNQETCFSNRLQRKPNPCGCGRRTALRTTNFSSCGPG